MTEFIQVSTTVNSKEGADKIARKLLDERLASCVQVLGPIHSNYWWKGKIDRARFLRFQFYVEISTISTGLEPKQPASQSPRKKERNSIMSSSSSYTGSFSFLSSTFESSP